LLTLNQAAVFDGPDFRFKFRDLPSEMNAKPRTWFYICLLTAGCFIFAVDVWVWRNRENRLPAEQLVRQQFESHRADYIRFATILQNDPSASYVGGNGTVDIDGIHGRLVTEYRDLAHKIGAKHVIIREDGSMEFALWGYGGPIESDSWMGVRYFPKNHKLKPAGWRQTVVTSLANESLPQEHGSVASGLYVVAIEPDWYAFRFEIQE
jgi:hypothetical protein